MSLSLSLYQQVCPQIERYGRLWRCPARHRRSSCCTYDAYYSDTSTKSFGGDYSTIMSMYECDGGAATGRQLATVVRNCSATAIPTTFLLLGLRPSSLAPTVQ